MAGWEFYHYLNGYITTAADKFACDCEQEFDTPGGFHRCHCGKQWNSYVIGTGGDGREAALEKVICREVPVRPGVIVASREDLGEDDEVEDDWPHHHPRIPNTKKSAPPDWHQRDRNQRWTQQVLPRPRQT